MRTCFHKNIILRAISSVCVATVLLMSNIMPAHATEAEESGGKTYEITIRAGEHGNFIDTIASAESVTPKKVVFRVNKGGSFSLDSTASIVSIGAKYSGKYYVVNQEYKIEHVTRNAEFVIEYGRLVNGIEYKVEFVDNATGVEIADPIFNWGSTGSPTEYYSAKNIANYALTGNASRRIEVLSETDKVLQFIYNSTLSGGSTTNTTYQTTDGGIENITETQQNPIYQTLPAEAPVAAQAATGGQGTGGGEDTATIEDEGTALEDTPAAEENEGVAPESDESSDGTTIEEEELPLAPGMNQPVNIAAVIAVMLGGIALILAVVWMIARRRITVIEDQDHDHDIDENL